MIECYAVSDRWIVHWCIKMLNGDSIIWCSWYCCCISCCGKLNGVEWLCRWVSSSRDNWFVFGCNVNVFVLINFYWFWIEYICAICVTNFCLLTAANPKQGWAWRGRVKLMMGYEIWGGVHDLWMTWCGRPGRVHWWWDKFWKGVWHVGSRDRW